MGARETYREIVLENIDYDILIQDPKMDRERLEDAKRECAEHKPPEIRKPGRNTPEHGDL